MIISVEKQEQHVQWNDGVCYNVYKTFGLIREIWKNKTIAEWYCIAECIYVSKVQAKPSE